MRKSKLPMVLEMSSSGKTSLVLEVHIKQKKPHVFLRGGLSTTNVFTINYP